MSKRKTISVAAFINIHIAVSGVAQTDIAAALGYEHPNVVTMIKQGKTKLPINKVGPLAKVLGIDPVDLLRRVMAEYMPDTYAAVQEVVGKSLITEHEMEIVRLVRTTCGDLNLTTEMPEHREVFIKVIDEMGFEQFQMAMKRGSSLPAPRPKRR